MTDGTGTTQYSYGPVGALGALRLVQTTSPPTRTIGYAYDEIGRMVSRSVSGSGVEALQYDALGRLSQHSSDLGTFNFAYLGQTDQITQRALASSTLKTVWSYLSNTGDRRLKEVDNVGLSTGQYSNFQIASNPEQIIEITEISDAAVVYPTPSSQTASFNSLN